MKVETTLLEVTDEDIKLLKSDPKKFWKDIKNIEEGAFHDCESLVEIEIPSTIRHIERSPFLYCNNLRHIVVDKNNEEYYSEGECLIEKEIKILIAGCSSSKIPNDVVSIGPKAFSFCEKLTEIQIPKSVTAIEEYAFHGCKNIVSVEIPESVNCIDVNSFLCCENLKHIVIDKNNKEYYSEGNCVIERKTRSLIIGCNSSKIPDSVTEIGCWAFYACRGLESVTLSKNLKIIKGYAFSYCESLTNVVIPQSVEKIEEYAFSDCKNLEKITIPKDTIVDETAFEGCEKLKEIVRV